MHGVKVVYTKEAETADTYIERATYELRRERRVRVATSDGPKQIIILGHGALRVSARAFHAEVEAAEGQISAVLQRLTNRPRSERTMTGTKGADVKISALFLSPRHRQPPYGVFSYPYLYPPEKCIN